MLTFIRPQVNQGGDGTADQMLLVNAGSVGITDGDFEGPAANGVHLVGSYGNRIGIVESWGQTNTVTVDSTSTGNEINCLGNCVLNIDPAQKYTTSVYGAVTSLNGAIPVGPTVGQAIDGKFNSIQLPTSQTYSMTRTLPTSTGSNNAVALGTFNPTASGGAMMDVAILVYGNGGYVATKYYTIPYIPAFIGSSVKISPLMTSGAYSGNDFDLNIQSGVFYLVRTAGSVAANAYIEIKFYTSANALYTASPDIWTPSTTVSTLTAATSIYGPSSITVAAGGLTVGGRCGSGDGATIECNDSPVINYPPNGSTLTGSTQVFSWPAVPGATGYFFWLGTTVGGNDILNGNPGTNTYITASGLPTAGANIYASLYAVQTTGTNKVATATYTAASANPTTIIQNNGVNVTPSSGAVNLAPGSNITLTTSGNQITIAASGSGGGTVSSYATCNGSTVPCQYTLTGQGANISATTLYTPSANEMHLVSCYETVTTTAASSSTSPACNVIWTDALSSVSSPSTQVATSTGNTLGAIPTSAVIPVQVKSGTNLQFSTTSYASAPANAMKYSVTIIVQ